MSGTTLDIEDLIQPDDLGCNIAREYMTFDLLRQGRIREVEKIQQYIYATSTKTTANSSLPWKNSTTIPKLCQIRDNLFANYMAALFPKRDFLEWEPADRSSSALAKRRVIKNYMYTVIEQPRFKEAIGKLVLDYIDYGQPFATVEWLDEQISQEEGFKTGYVGPVIKRISPLDIVFNPTASIFADAPKIVRNVMTLGELASQLAMLSEPDYAEETKAAFDYMIKLRQTVGQTVGGYQTKNNLYAIAGFTSYDAYLRSPYCEILTFLGDYYDVNKNKLYKNYVIHVADRHKIIGMRPNQSVLGKNTIRSVSWRTRQDNQWAMGPLDNLVGMQYRIDHIENLKADVFDLIAAPPLKIKGLVEDFVWGPFARIYVGDDGDVEVLAKGELAGALQPNIEIERLQMQMEEMAGSPKEAAGFRTPGEKTAFEVQRLENAAARIFLTKTQQFESQFLEPLLNDMLEMARRKMSGELILRVFNDELQATEFMAITQDDLSGIGKVRAIGARNYAEKAERVQNFANLYSSIIGVDEDVKAHFSSIKIATAMEELLNLEDYDIVKPYIRMVEQTEAQKLMNVGMEQVQMEAATPSGMSPDDADVGAEGEIAMEPALVE